jgi:hypothetical protein
MLVNSSHTRPCQPHASPRYRRFAAPSRRHACTRPAIGQAAAAPLKSSPCSSLFLSLRGEGGLEPLALLRPVTALRYALAFAPGPPRRRARLRLRSGSSLGRPSGDLTSDTLGHLSKILIHENQSSAAFKNVLYAFFVAWIARQECPGIHEAQANARLIAAAPGLLVTLKDIAACADAGRLAYGDHESRPMLEPTRDDARAAIAKA